MALISQSHLREYETLYILRPEIEDEVAIALINKMKGMVESEGKHLQVTNWGRKKLAWERDRHQKGMFVHHRYLGKPGLVKTYERSLKIDENVILRQTIVLDKAVDPETRQPEADVFDPPVTKEARREEEPRDRPRRFDGDRDRGDRDDRGDRGDRDRDRGDRDRDRD